MELRYNDYQNRLKATVEPQPLPKPVDPVVAKKNSEDAAKLAELEQKLLEVQQELRSKLESKIEQVSSLTPQQQFRLERKQFHLEGLIKSARPEREAYKKAPAVFVTGASSGFYIKLLNLIGSVHFWSPNRNILVFNLGLQESELETLRGLDRVLIMDSEQKTNLMNYAWKNVAIRKAVDTYGKVIWVDAGGDIRSGLERIDKILENEDNFFVQGQDVDMSPWSHPGTLEFFETTKAFVKDKYSFSGNCQGYVLDSQAYWDVLRVVELCCKFKECISPAGSSLMNHRYDQIAMSSAIYTNQEMDAKIQPHTELLAAVRQQVESDPTKPSNHIVHSKRNWETSEYTKYLKRTGQVFDAPTAKELVKQYFNN